MTNQDDKLPESLHAAARDYNNPPALGRADVDDMWSAIESEAFPKRFRSPTAEHLLPSAESRGPRAVGWFSVRTLLPLAAVLLLGVAIGRFGFARSSQVIIVDRALPTDSLAVPDAYQSTTSRYLGQATALLVALPADASSDRADAVYLNRAHDLLLTTRLLLDSPAATDPRFRTLLEDLELVLAQVVRLHSEKSRAELDLIRQALEQRDVLPRLRTAVADISADD